MACIRYNEHPAQAGGCLPGAFAAYVDRIPVEQYGSLDAAWRALQQRTFEADDGSPRRQGDHRCVPVQRSRIWPQTLNCWEITAHWVAAAKRFLPDSCVINVWDRDLASGVRHVWPTLELPDGRQLLVDLRTAKLKQYPMAQYHGALAPANADTQDYVDTGFDLVGGVGGAVVAGYAGKESGEAVAKGIDGLQKIVDGAAFGGSKAEPARIPSPQELEGKLVQATDDPRVYRVEAGKKRWVTREEVMRTRFGAQLVKGRWTGVLYVPAQALEQIPDGEPIEPDGDASASTQARRSRVRIRTRRDLISAAA